MKIIFEKSNEIDGGDSIVKPTPIIQKSFVKKEEPVIKEATEDEPEVKGDSIFHVWIWPGPYIFDLTDKSKMIENTFPFSNEGKEQAVDWINEQYEVNKSKWPRRKTDELP